MIKNNKWTYLRLVVVLFSVMTVGCSTYGKISALPTDNQELIHQDGQKTLTSEKYNLVSLSPKSEEIKNVGWGEFILTIKNRSLNNMQFSMNDISVHSYEVDSDKVMALKVFKREELIKKEKSSQKSRNAWDTLGSVLNVLNVAVSAGTGSYSSGLSDQKKHEDSVAKSKKRHKETLKNLESLMQENTMVLPGEKMNGLIRVQLPKITDARKKIMFSIKLDEEEHKLAFIQEKIEKNK